MQKFDKEILKRQFSNTNSKLYEVISFQITIHEYFDLISYYVLKLLSSNPFNRFFKLTCCPKS